MTLYSRRDMAAFALGGLACRRLLAAADSSYKGVRLGVGTGAFGSMATPFGPDYVDKAIQGCTTLGITNAELVDAVIEPRIPGMAGRGVTVFTDENRQARNRLREWRLATPLTYFEEIRKKFHDRGITLISYVMTFDDDFPDEEIEAAFRQAEALGVEFISTNRTKVHMGRRLVPFAEKHRAKPAFHNHADVKLPDEIATPESLNGLLGLSQSFRVNLDIGWYHVAGFDPLEFIAANHARISHLHIKDRRRSTGEATDCGEGGTPVREVMRLIQKERYPIYCVIEREFGGTGTPLEETRKWLEYMKGALS